MSKIIVLEAILIKLDFSLFCVAMGNYPCSLATFDFPIGSTPTSPVSVASVVCCDAMVCCTDGMTTGSGGIPVSPCCTESAEDPAEGCQTI